MAVLVTGATGFVGSHLVHELLTRGQPVRVLARNGDKAVELERRGAEVVVGNLCDAVVSRQAVNGAAVIYHCASAHSTDSPDDIRRTNVEGMRTFLDAIIGEQAGRLVFLSSINTLGDGSYVNATEDRRPRRCGDVHVDAKLAAERMVADYQARYSLQATILRPGLIYGPGEKNLPKIASAIRRGKFRFLGSRENIIPLIYISDMVAAIIAAGETPQANRQIYNITDGSRTTIGELADTLAELLRCDRPAKTLPYFVPWLASRLFELLRKQGPITRAGLRFLGTSRHVSILRAKDELGFKPRVGLNQGLEATLEWLQKASQELDKAA